MLITAMTGEQLRKQLTDDKVNFADLARRLGYDNTQRLYSKLNAKSLSKEFIDDVNRIVYSDAKPEEDENLLARLKMEADLLKMKTESLEILVMQKDKVIADKDTTIDQQKYFIDQQLGKRKTG